ncbi:MAG TPA: hypothetical protein VHB30_11625 [Solirubrobacteraceae bacterium]|jgi:hypothetical protein|nr:hypothetical protein [Solirubrobacteraceae bacterium]
MRRATLAALAVAAAALAACGTSSPDDLVAHRTGSGPGAKLTLRVIDDGTVSCDGDRPVQITSKELIDTRALVDDLEDLAKAGRSLPARPGSVLRYEIETEDGTVRFADNSARQPAVFYRAQALIRKLAVGPCRLPR